MRSLILPIAVFTLVSCGPQVSGEVGKACIAGGRDAASRSLCSCVQRAADATLNGSDQIKAASFFAEPDLAQQTRQSDRGSDERFWDRYQRFSSTARQSCG